MKDRDRPRPGGAGDGAEQHRHQGEHGGQGGQGGGGLRDCYSESIVDNIEHTNTIFIVTENIKNKSSTLHNVLFKKKTNIFIV